MAEVLTLIFKIGMAVAIAVGLLAWFALRMVHQARPGVGVWTSRTRWNPFNLLWMPSIARLNANKVSGERLAKIHGVGFMSAGTTNRFGILMREVARRNGGTFLALKR